MYLTLIEALFAFLSEVNKELYFGFLRLIVHYLLKLIVKDVIAKSIDQHKICLNYLRLT